MTAVPADQLKPGQQLRDFWSPTFVVSIVPTLPRNGRPMVTVTWHRPAYQQAGQAEGSGQYDVLADYPQDIWPRHGMDPRDAADPAARISLSNST
jgi:hypothetical protein